MAPWALVLLAGCTGSDELVIEGRAQRLVLDGPGEAREVTVLERPDGDPVELIDAGAVATGAMVRAHGHFMAEGGVAGYGPPFGVRRLEVWTAAPRPLVVDPTRAPPPRKLAVVLFNFKNDDRQPITPADVKARIFGPKGSTRAFYKEQSFGLVDIVGKVDVQGGDVFGWYTIDAANRPCAQGSWGEAALAAAMKAGVDTTGYDHIVFFFPATPACPYLGLGQQPGARTWINGASIATFTHELGHNVGTPHASARTCTAPGGSRVTLSATCKDSEYGNPFDVMGNGFLHTNAYNKAQARWLSGGNVQVAGDDGIYTLLAQERPATGVQVLSVRRDESTYYYLEYRQPFGFDNFAGDAAVARGVTVLVGGSLREISNSYLLDLHPATSTLDDAPLALGQSYEDGKASVRLTVTELTADAAKVQVTFLATPAPDASAGDAAVPDKDGATAVAAPSGGGCAVGGSGPGAGASLLALVVIAMAGLGRRRRVLAAVMLLAGTLGCGGDRWPAPAPGHDGGPSDAAVDVRPDGKIDGSDGKIDGNDGGGGEDALDDDGGSPAEITLYPVPAPVEQACRRHAEVYCARLAECLPARLASDYQSADICKARREQTCRGDFLAAGRAETPANRLACADALAAQTCRDFYFNRSLPACDAPPGTLAAGAACFRSSQCAAGLMCKLEVNSCGTCQPALAPGADCGWWAGGCPLGTACFDDVCLAPRKRGESCKATSAPCEAGTDCTATGCVDRTADRGAPCTAADLCDPIKGLYCNLTTGVCDPLPGPAAAGERCNTFDANGAPVSCGPDGTCFSPSALVTATSTCVARVDIGQRCDPAMGKQCRVPAACAHGMCVAPMIVQGGMYMPPLCK